jgi:hypothetical protein|tara:strand:- start:3544 stop:3738 length:195 start_codon:yes stop_codon:yes gene_type:complete
MSAMGQYVYEMQEFAEDLLMCNGNNLDTDQARIAFIDRYPTNGQVFDQVYADTIQLTGVSNDPY